jgi:hypothetical protein
LSVRLISLRLPTGELEVLAPSLLDEAAYPSQAFGPLYALRWGIETFYGLLKGRLGLEHFSGESLEAVRQDFFSCVFLSNVESVFACAGPAGTDAQRRHPARVNRAQSFQALKKPGAGALLQRGARRGTPGPADAAHEGGAGGATAAALAPTSAAFAVPVAQPPAL